MDNRLIRVLLAIGRTVLAIGIVISLAASLLLFSLSVLFDRELYRTHAQTKAFVTALQTDVDEFLEDECLFYGIPREVVSTVLTAEQIQKAAETRMLSVYDALCNGSEPVTVTVDAAPFTKAIQAYFDTLPIEEQPLDTMAAATIAADFAKGTASVMQLGLTAKMVQTAHPLFAEGSLPRRVVSLYPWWSLATVVLVAISLLPFKSALRQRAYGTAGALFVGSALAAVPTWLFVSLDFPASIALGESALREYIRLVLYAVLERTQAITTTAFVIGAVLLIATIVWNVCRKPKA